MKTQKKLFSVWVILIILLSGAVRGDDYPWPKYKMSDFGSFQEYFDAMIPHIKTSHDASRPKEAYEHFGTGAFPALKPYLTLYDNLNVRFSAYGHLFIFIGLAQDQGERQAMFLSFIHGLNDPEEGIRQYVARRMNTFGTQIFTEEAEKFMLSRLKAASRNSHTYEHVILATGMIGLKEAIPILKKIDDDYSRFALARMGDKESLKALLAEFPTKPTAKDMEGRLYWKLKYLAYTKQPEAIELLINYLYSDAMQPGGGDYPPQYLAGWAAGILTELIGDMNVKDYEAGTPENVRRCREWIKKNYRGGKIPALFPGEIRQWD